MKHNFYSASPFLYAIAASAATLSATSCSEQKARDNQRYNIVYIMSDDHTAQMMSCYDNRYISTPNLDRIAEEGVRFTNSFVANSLSGPSRACLLTGKHSHANGYMDNKQVHAFDGSQQTFPKLLQEAGYQTAIIGKWHLGGTPTGFDYWDVIPGQGHYYNPDFRTADGTKMHEGYISDIITDKSLAWLESRDKDRPFCLMIHHKACHREWQPDFKYLEEYEDITFPIPETFYDDYEGRIAAQQQEMTIEHEMRLVADNKLIPEHNKGKQLPEYKRLTKEQAERYEAVYGRITEDFHNRKLTGKDLVEWKYQRYMRDYAKVVKSMDDNVGRVLDYLEQTGLKDNTIIIYTSDQGFYMGEHGWFDKRFMYEESMRTPLVMSLPKGFKRKGDISEMVQNIDHAPTFLDIAGVEVPKDMHGKSLLPLLKGKKVDDWRTSLYYHYYEYPAVHMVKKHYGVRTDRYKLIHFYDDIDCWELYDLKNDPSELNNLYGKSEYAEVVAEMMKELDKLQEQYQDPIRLSY